MDLALDDGQKVKNIAWMYWLPNPLFPSLRVWYRIGLPRTHPELLIEEFEALPTES